MDVGKSTRYVHDDGTPTDVGNVVQKILEAVAPRYSEEACCNRGLKLSLQSDLSYRILTNPCIDPVQAARWSEQTGTESPAPIRGIRSRQVSQTAQDQRSPKSVFLVLQNATEEINDPKHKGNRRRQRRDQADEKTPRRGHDALILRCRKMRQRLENARGRRPFHVSAGLPPNKSTLYSYPRRSLFPVPPSPAPRIPALIPGSIGFAPPISWQDWLSQRLSWRR